MVWLIILNVVDLDLLCLVVVVFLKGIFIVFFIDDYDKLKYLYEYIYVNCLYLII